MPTVCQMLFSKRADDSLQDYKIIDNLCSQVTHDPEIDDVIKKRVSFTASLYNPLVPKVKK